MKVMRGEGIGKEREGERRNGRKRRRETIGVTSGC